MSEQQPLTPEELFKKVEAFLKAQHEVYAPVGDIPLPAVTGSAALPLQESPAKIVASGNPAAAAGSSQPNPVDASPDQQHPTETKADTLIQSLQDCKTLDALRELCEAAAVLRTDLTGTRLVFGKGNPKADLMLIGEAPGAKEDELGEPFVGASGNLLTKILAAIKVDRSQIYIANILKHRPPDNRNPTAEERARSLPFLERQIDLIQPKLILCLGLISAQTLLNTTTALKDMRGTFHPYRGAELMVTYHPAALLRNKHLKRDTWEDVQKLRQRYDILGCEPVLLPYLQS